VSFEDGELDPAGERGVFKALKLWNNISDKKIDCNKLALKY
jgi:hypothetical protein